MSRSLRSACYPLSALSYCRFSSLFGLSSCVFSVAIMSAMLLQSVESSAIDAFRVDNTRLPNSLPLLCIQQKRGAPLPLQFPSRDQMARLCARMMALAADGADADGGIRMAPQSRSLGARQDEENLASGMMNNIDDVDEMGPETRFVRAGEKRSYDYIRFGKRDGSDAGRIQFVGGHGKVMDKKGAAKGTYDYIRFG